MNMPQNIESPLVIPNMNQPQRLIRANTFEYQHQQNVNFNEPRLQRLQSDIVYNGTAMTPSNNGKLRTAIFDNVVNTEPKSINDRSPITPITTSYMTRGSTSSNVAAMDRFTRGGFTPDVVNGGMNVVHGRAVSRYGNNEQQ